MAVTVSPGNGVHSLPAHIQWAYTMLKYNYFKVGQDQNVGEQNALRLILFFLRGRCNCSPSQVQPKTLTLIKDFIKVSNITSDILFF